MNYEYIQIGIKNNNEPILEKRAVLKRTVQYYNKPYKGIFRHSAIDKRKNNVI